MTGTGDGVAVTPEALVAHARTLDTVGGTVQAGIGAANHVRLGSEAYGQLCRALPAMLTPLHDLVDQTLREARSSMDEAAHAVRSAARDYQRSDLTAARRLTPGRPDLSG